MTQVGHQSGLQAFSGLRKIPCLSLRVNEMLSLELLMAIFATYMAWRQCREKQEREYLPLGLST